MGFYIGANWTWEGSLVSGGTTGNMGAQLYFSLFLLVFTLTICTLSLNIYSPIVLYIVYSLDKSFQSGKIIGKSFVISINSFDIMSKNI